MLLSTLSSIMTLLLCCLATPLLAAEPANFSRQIVASLANPMTVRIKSHLFTISKTKKLLSINSTDPSQKPCQLSVNPFDENIEGRIHAAALEFTKKIIVWGVQSTELDGTVRRTYYTLLFIDPFACNYKPLRLPEDEVPETWPVLAPTITNFDKSYDPNFEVYFPTQQKCHPCIYNSRDAGVKWVYSTLDAEAGVPLDEFWMQWYRSGDWNYLFYVYNFQSNSTVLKLIDSNKNAKLQRNVDHHIKAVSISYGNYQNTAFCYVTPKNPSLNETQNVTCERLNERLRPALTWQLPASKDRLVSDVVLEIDGLGNTFAGVMYSREIRFYAYNVDGDLIGDLDFGEVNKELNYKELHGIRVGSEYCLVTVEQANINAVEARHVIKCVDVSKYLE